MPIDVDGLIDSLRRGVAALPPVVIAVVLLAGPTAALIGYRIMGYRMAAAARRMQALHAVEAVAMWVCHDCRSVNELRVSRCYRCSADRDAIEDLEIILDMPTAAPTFFQVPAGSPFAAVSAATSHVAPERSSKPLLKIASTRRPAAAALSRAPEPELELELEPRAPEPEPERTTPAPGPGIPVMADASFASRAVPVMADPSSATDAIPVMADASTETVAVPVMAHASVETEAIPVGFGEPIEAPAWPSQVFRERVRVARPASEPDDAASTNGTGSGSGPRT